MKSSVSEMEMVESLRDPKLERARGRGIHLDIIIENGIVEWTCPVCGNRNIHKWFGREYHVCNDCQQPTNIKSVRYCKQ